MQLALDLHTIDDDDDKIDAIMPQEAAHHLFVFGKTAQVVDAGQVDDFDNVRAEDQAGREQVNGDTRPVAGTGGSAGEAIEKGGFAGIGHAHQRHTFTMGSGADGLRR